MNTQKSDRMSMWGQEGFTLIEAMVAIVIFAIGIIGCYTMQISSMRSSTRANSMTASSTWATYAVENLLSLEFDNDLIKNGAGNANGLLDIDDTNKAGDTPDGQRFVRPDGTVATTADASDLYTVYWNIADNYPLTDTKQIRMHVVRNVGANSAVLFTQDYYKTNENL